VTPFLARSPRLVPQAISSLVLALAGLLGAAGACADPPPIADPASGFVFRATDDWILVPGRDVASDDGGPIASGSSTDYEASCDFRWKRVAGGLPAAWDVAREAQFGVLAVVAEPAPARVAGRDALHGVLRTELMSVRICHIWVIPARGKDRYVVATLSAPEPKHEEYRKQFDPILAAARFLAEGEAPPADAVAPKTPQREPCMMVDEAAKTLTDPRTGVVVPVTDDFRFKPDTDPTSQAEMSGPLCDAFTDDLGAFGIFGWWGDSGGLESVWELVRTRQVVEKRELEKPTRVKVAGKEALHAALVATDEDPRSYDYWIIQGAAADRYVVAEVNCKAANRDAQRKRFEQVLAALKFTQPTAGPAKPAETTGAGNGEKAPPDGDVAKPEAAPKSKLAGNLEAMGRGENLATAAAMARLWKKDAILVAVTGFNVREDGTVDLTDGEGWILYRFFSPGAKSKSRRAVWVRQSGMEFDQDPDADGFPYETELPADLIDWAKAYRAAATEGVTGRTTISLGIEEEVELEQPFVWSVASESRSVEVDATTGEVVRVDGEER